MKLLMAMVLASTASVACMASGEGTAPVAVSPVATATVAGTRPGVIITTPARTASPQATGTGAARTPSPAATPGPGTPVATPNTAGRAITVGDVQQAWAARSITYQASSGSAVPTGFTVPGSALTLSKGGQTVDVVVFVYPTQSAADQDWTLGSAPAPKPGKNLGAFAAVWWNENMVMVLRERRGDLTNDARDAFLSLGGPLPTTPAPAATRAPLGSATPAPAGGGTVTATAAPARTPATTATAAPVTPAGPTGTPTPAPSLPTPQVPR